MLKMIKVISSLFNNFKIDYINVIWVIPVNYNVIDFCDKRTSLANSYELVNDNDFIYMPGFAGYGVWQVFFAVEDVVNGCEFHWIVS